MLMRGECDDGKSLTCRNVCTQSLERTFTTALCRRSKRPIRHVILRQETLVQFCRETADVGRRGGPLKPPRGIHNKPRDKRYEDTRLTRVLPTEP